MVHNPTLRVIKILNAVATQNDQLTMSGIARECQIPVGTVLPILRTLCDQDFLAYHETHKTYQIGLKCFLAGQAYAVSNTSFAGIEGVIGRLTEATKETSHYCVLEGGDVLYVLKRESPEPIRMYSAIGKKLPAYGTAIGKALLSGLSKEEVQALYPDGLKAMTPHTITDIGVLFQQLQDIRKSGFAYECEESNMGIRCIAKPIHSKTGKVVSAISVVIPIFRYNREKEELVKTCLLTAGRDIELLLPYSGEILR